MKKKLLSVFLCCAMVFSMAACGTTAETPATGEGNNESGNVTAEGATYTVGICQLVQHDALDAATQGFEDALTEALGDSVTFDYQNAQGDSATCSTIVTGFVSNNYDLIMANATPALQAAVSATDTIPILGTSITDYATALALTSWDGTTGMNVSGTSDLAPLDQQEDMILELCPEVSKVAIIYCSAEANSVYQASEITKFLEEDGVDSAEYTFADSNDIQSVVTAAVAECDVVYIPTDNTAASNMTIISNICQPAGIPVICGEENMMNAGGLATLSISYYDIGYAAGQMAVEVLLNGADVSTMPVQTASTTTKKYNAAYAEAIGMEMPADYEASEAE